MNEFIFPELKYEEIKETRDSIQAFAKLLSAIGGQLIPHDKNWEEYSLKVYSRGLTTLPIPFIKGGIDKTFELKIDLVDHQLQIYGEEGITSVMLASEEVKEFAENIKEQVKNQNVVINEEIFNEIRGIKGYNKEAASKLFQVIKVIDLTLKEFKGNTLAETSSVQFWPHHFDIAMLWFSGKLISGQDSANWDNSREQMNFGFSSGDGGIPEPYFYVTSYPFPDEVFEMEFSNNAYWHKEGWKGAVLKYGNITGKDGKKILLNYFNEVKNKVTALMP